MSVCAWLGPAGLPPPSARSALIPLACLTPTSSLVASLSRLPPPAHAAHAPLDSAGGPVLTALHDGKHLSTRRCVIHQFMSEPELLAYMSTNDDFDLPRWHTQQPHDALSSSAQAAQTAAQSSYLYGQGPPPQSGVSSNRLPAIHQSPSSTGHSRQPRAAQLMDEDQQYSLNANPYSSGNMLSRSVSMGGAATSRGRRHHLPDDLEGAFNVEGGSAQRQSGHGLPQHVSTSLYPSSVVYQQSPSLSATASSANTSNSGVNVVDPYQDAYFPSSGNHPPKRSQTTHDASTSSRTPRSPHRGANPSHAMLDPYSPQQSQYNPPSSAYPYSPTAESRTFPPQASYQTHSRTQSQAKAEPMTPPLPPPYRAAVKQEDHPMTSAYSPPTAMQPANTYSPSYHMNATSPTPAAQNLTVTRQARSSVSQPPTPLSYHSSQGSGTTHSPYYGQDHQPMAVEPPPKHRPSGLRRVRDQRDLRPYVNPQPSGRRMDTTGAYLSVCHHTRSMYTAAFIDVRTCVYSLSGS